MRWLLLALCACNRILGLDDVGARAPFFDAPQDAQPYCPTIGTVPVFSPNLHQVIDQDCMDYSTTMSGGFAIGSCLFANHYQVSQGMIDRALEPLAGLPVSDYQTDWFNLRLAPEGDVIYYDSQDRMTGVFTFASFIHVDGTTWTAGPTLPVPGNLASAPSQGPARHMLFGDYASTQLAEWALDGAGAWQPVRTFDIGVFPVHVWLAPDDRHAIAVAHVAQSSELGVVYLDRASATDDFEPPIILSSLPSTFDLFVTGDCSRAYMTAAASIFYADQI